jgi:acetyl esterase
LALALKAKREGWSDRIAGVHALCPYVSGAYGDPPDDLPSLRENDGYFLSCQLCAIFAEVYDPGARHADDPRCWPLRAIPDDLAGLPPHAISVNELDPLRDEGLAYHRRLVAAGVDAVCRTVRGTTHGADTIFRAELPDIYAATIRDIKSFADRVRPH